MTRKQKIQQHYINTGCSVKELSEEFNIPLWVASDLINEAIVIIKGQHRIERLLDAIELAEEENQLI